MSSENIKSNEINFNQGVTRYNNADRLLFCFDDSMTRYGEGTDYFRKVRGIIFFSETRKMFSTTLNEPSMGILDAYHISSSIPVLK